jgi:hypothetical protein
MAIHGTDVTDRVRANRANALKSTGPKSEEGKRKASRNAVRHGLCAAVEVVTAFDPVLEFLPFQESMHEHFDPCGPYEIALVERIVACMWRLRRLINLEAQAMWSNSQMGAKPAWAFTYNNSDARFLNMSRYETAIERSLYRAMQELRMTQEGRKADNLVLALPSPTEDRDR